LEISITFIFGQLGPSQSRNLSEVYANWEFSI